MPALRRIKTLLCRTLFCAALLLPLSACTATNKPGKPTGSAADYRRQAAREIYEYRYAEAATALHNAIALEPAAPDFLRLGDLQEVLGRNRKALETYRNGLRYATTPEHFERLNYYRATLEVLEFNRFDQLDKTLTELPADSQAALNLQALRELRQNRLNTALGYANRSIAANQDQEMTGWAHYFAAEIWTAAKNFPNAFEALFYATNHARGRSLVARITKLWEDLKQRPLPE